MLTSVFCTVCIYLGQRSYHFDRSQPWNETNNAIGAEYRNFFAVRFTNSYGDLSTAIGYRPEISWHGIEFGAKIGVVEGYKQHLRWWQGGEVAPFILPEAAIPLGNRLALNVNLLPGEFVSVGFKLNIGN